MRSEGILFEGSAVYMNGQDYIVPGLSFGQLKQNYDTVTAPIGGEGDGNLVAQGERLIPIIGMALRRNYPEVTDEMLWDWIDPSTFVQLILAVRGSSGLKDAAPGE